MRYKEDLGFNVLAVATDVDGTLTDENYLIDLKAIEAIRALERNNVKVLLSTGNAVPYAMCLGRYIGTSGPVIAENGGVIYYEEKLHLLADRGKAEKALKALKGFFGDRVVESITNQFRLADLVILRTLDVNELRKTLKGFPVKVYDSKFAIHVIDREIDKGKALVKALNLMGVKRSEVAVIGDSELDLSMFQVSSFSVALKNSPEKLKRKANYVTKKKYGGGFVEAVKRIFPKIFNDFRFSLDKLQL